VRSWLVEKHISNGLKVFPNRYVGWSKLTTAQQYEGSK